MRPRKPPLLMLLYRAVMPRPAATIRVPVVPAKSTSRAACVNVERVSGQAHSLRIRIVRGEQDRADRAVTDETRERAPLAPPACSTTLNAMAEPVAHTRKGAEEMRIPPLRLYARIRHSGYAQFLSKLLKHMIAHFCRGNRRSVCSNILCAVTGFQCCSDG